MRGQTCRRLTFILKAPICLASAALLVLTPAPAFAQSDSVNWRIWNTADGMTESFTANVSVTPSGSIIAKHGNVPLLNLLDGYRVTGIPDPHTVGRTYGDTQNHLYTFDWTGLRIFDGNTWHSSSIPEFGKLSALRKFGNYRWFDYSLAVGLRMDDRAAAIPLTSGKVLVMLPDVLLEWSADSGTKRVIKRVGETSLGAFLDLQPADSDRVWVSGKHGLGSLRVSEDRYEWNEIAVPPAGAARLTFPDGDTNGNILVSAQRKDGGNSVLLQHGGSWTSIYKGKTEQVRAWHGSEGFTWIVDGDRLLALSGTQTRRVPVPSALSGRLYDILVQPGGVFWMATAQGLARYAPALWQAPEGTPELETVNAMAQQADGRLWLVSGHLVVSREASPGGQVDKAPVWRTFTLPAGESQDVSKTDSIWPMDNGRLILATDNPYHLLELDPLSGSFRTIKDRHGRRFGWTQHRDARTMWVVTTRTGDEVSQLEIFDGNHFEPVPGLDALPVTDVRSVMQAKDGAIWVGGTGKLVVARGGHIQVLSKNEGLTEETLFGMFQAPDGTIYLGQRDTVTAWDGKQFHVLRRGVDRARSFAMTADGVIWVASGTGIHRYARGAWITNSAEEGLPSPAAYKVLVDQSGHVWAGSTLGVSTFHPEADGDPPLATIQDQRNLRETPPGGEVRLIFSGQDRWKQTIDTRLLFSWRLDGTAWSGFGEGSFVSLKDLPAGNHVFYLRAMDRNGNMSINPASFAFSVLFPWYREKGFYVVAVLFAIALLLLVRTAIKHHSHLKFQSRHDPLTGLPNRTGLERALDEVLKNSRGPGGSVAVMFLDLDGFKQVNDLFGHGTGDALLREIGTCITQHLGTSDIVARLGGDEFAVVLSDPGGPEEIAAVAGRILESIRHCSGTAANCAKVSASIGISLHPEHARDAKTLLRLADVAMYRSKTQQGDCFIQYEPTMLSADLRTPEIAQAIRSALAEGGLILEYQPIVGRDGEIAQMEALVRLESPKLGRLMPDQFIGIAEKTGLIHEVGIWIVREACQRASRWRETGLFVPVAINVSAMQLDSANFADQVLKCLAISGLPSSAVAVEITESALARDPNRAEVCLQRLRGEGVFVSLDDFGTGYSSLSILQRLPIDSVKVDRSFIAGMASSSRTLGVVSQMIGLAKSLGLRTVAEGIEEPAQMELARQMGCDYFQGFLISKPLSAEAATAFLVAGPAPGEMLACSSGRSGTHQPEADVLVH